MYAWRARIGLVHPTHRGKVFGFWYDHAPAGVEIVPTFIGFRRSTPETFAAGIDRAADLARDLKNRGCTLISVSGTPPFLLKGLEFERKWGQQLSEELDLPVVTPVEPHALALKALGVETVALASYYGDELNQAIVDYLSAFGLKTYILGGFSQGDKGDALYTTSLSALDDVSYFQVYEYCKSRLKALGVSVDAIYINGAGWDALPAVNYLEEDLRVKVVLALGAEMWLAYDKLSIRNQVQDCGALLRDDYRPPSPTEI